MLLKALIPFAIVAVAVGAAPVAQEDPKPPFHEEMKKIFSASDETWDLYKASKQAARPAFPSKRTGILDGVHGQVSHAFPMPISGDHIQGESKSKTFKSDIKSPQESLESVYIRDNTIVSNRRAQSNPVEPVAGMAVASIYKATAPSPLTSEIKEMEKSHRPDSEHDSTVVSDAVNPLGRATHRKLHQNAHDTNTPDPQDSAVDAMENATSLGGPAGLEPVFQLFAHKGMDTFHGQGIHVRGDFAGNGSDKDQQGTLSSPVDTYSSDTGRTSDQFPASNRSV